MKDNNSSNHNNKILNIAKKFKSNGLSIIPVATDKTPLIKWTKYSREIMSDEEIEEYFGNGKTEYIGIVCGGISNNLMLIDFDLKYDLTKDLMNMVKRAVPKSIYSKMWINKTRKGGFHWVYRTESYIEGGNQKLAQRHTTKEEKNETYIKNRKEKGKTKEEAIKIASNDKVRVLIETRQEGGYFVAYGNGYEYVEGKLSTLTVEEHNLLIETLISFNEYFVTKDEYIHNPITKEGTEGKNPFEEYNKNGDVHQLLINNGWNFVFEDSSRIYYKRPGDSSSKFSGNYHKQLKLFKVFSTSTQFEVGKGYTPVSLFIELEANGDKKLASKKLVELGFGEEDYSETFIKKCVRELHLLSELIDSSLKEKPDLKIFEKIDLAKKALENINKKQ